jgi:pantetheine-phosphate adenylyltransferase
MTRLRCVCLGGTFDHIHRGHRALLDRAFAVADRVYIGVTSDRLVEALGKQVEHPYEERARRLKAFLEARYPGREFRIFRLDDYFGPVVFTEEVEGIVVSEETEHRVALADRERARRGLPPLKRFVIPLIPAEDGGRLSSTRIRQGEIDEEGRVLKKRAGNPL